MKIIIVHQHVPAGAGADERDVLDQAAAIREALTAKGHSVSVLACTTDLGNVRRKLEVQKPDCVFNLVETLDGSGRLIHLAPAAWEVAEIPFTGSSADALYLTTHKLFSKERMLAAGLPVPVWIELRPDTLSALKAGAPSTAAAPHTRATIFGSDDTGPGDWIVKSVWEHASVGLSDSCILRGVSAAEAATRIPSGSFAERFVDGREFNLSILAGPNGPEVLPPAEIAFIDFPADKPKIVNYQAKWNEDSFEYTHTVRRFADPAADGPLLAELKRLALRCWDVFALGGYARVDFRVDASGQPWILEVNANPCLSPDGGFAAALEKAGIPYADAMERIVNAVARASCPCASPAPAQAERPSQDQKPAVIWRHELVASDVEAIRAVTLSTGYFHDYEVPVAVELAEERLAKGAASGYEFVVAECDGKVVGYTSFGPVPCTKSSFDWYWLAVRPEYQGFGFGKQLLQQVEARAKAMGGTRLFCETSSRPQYASTRAFYERMGFTLCELLEDFYEPGDGRATYSKPL